MTVEKEKTYWNSNGKYQVVIDQLSAMIPDEGTVPDPWKNRALEKFRKASNCYYDLYNNGLCNRNAEFRQVFGITPSLYRTRWNDWFADSMFILVEQAMDDIILAACAEQGIALATEAV